MQFINSLNFLDGRRDPNDPKFPYWPLLNPGNVARFRDPSTGNVISSKDGAFESLDADRFAAYLAPFPAGATVVVDTEGAKGYEWHFDKPRSVNVGALAMTSALLTLLRGIRPDLKYSLNAFPYADSGETWKLWPAEVAARAGELSYITSVLKRDIVPQLDSLACEIYYVDRYGNWLDNFFANVPSDPQHIRMGWWHAMNLAVASLLPFEKPLLWVFSPAAQWGSRKESWDELLGGRALTADEFGNCLRFALGWGQFKQCMLWGNTQSRNYRKTPDGAQLPVFDSAAPWWQYFQTIL